MDWRKTAEKCHGVGEMLANKFKGWGLKPRHAVLAVIAAVVVGVSAYQWWPQPAEDEVVARIQSGAWFDEVYVGGHYVGRTPLALTRSTVAGLHTSLGDGQGARVVFDTNWGECFFIFNERGQERITLKPFWPSAWRYRTYPTPEGDRALLTRNEGYSGHDLGKEQGAYKSRRGSGQVVLAFDQGFPSSSPGSKAVVDVRVTNESGKDIMGTGANIQLSFAPFDGRWGVVTDGAKTDVEGLVWEIPKGNGLVKEQSMRCRPEFQAPLRAGLYRVRAQYLVRGAVAETVVGGSVPGYGVLEVQ